MKKGLRGGENLPPSGVCTLKWAVSYSPELQVQLPLLTVLCTQPSNQIKTYFYFSLNYCQRCHKYQRQTDRFVLNPKGGVISNLVPHRPIFSGQ